MTQRTKKAPEEEITPQDPGISVEEVVKIQEMLDSVYTEMRRTNVNRGLKVQIHERWCHNLHRACEQLRKLHK